jgi:hypothetical protein
MRQCLVATITFASALLVSPLYAQQHETPSVESAIQQQYNSIQRSLLAAANDMPESDYSFKPVPAERDFGGWVAHLADAQTSICSGINGAPQNIHAAAMTSKADLVNALKMSFATCDAAYNGLTAANANDPVPLFRGKQPRLAALAANIAHDNEGYGSMAVYMRLKGLVPPSSQPRTGMR